jgi:hypothetical protein
LIVWFSQTNSKASLIASAISPVGANLRAGMIDTENQQMLKASNPIYIDAELTSEHQGPILFWNDKPENIMISIKNTGEKVLSSMAVEGSSYDVLTKLKISYTDTNGLVVDNFERDLRQPINKGDPKWQPIDFPLPKITS